jgi:hypothetical protein
VHKEQAQMADAVRRVGRRDSLTMFLLLRAIEILEGVVAKKRGNSAVEAVREAARREKYDLAGCYLKLVELEAALQPQKRGPKPGPKRPKYGSTGRPTVWIPLLASHWLERLERGKAMLRDKGERITKVRAYEVVISEDSPNMPRSDRKALAQKLARRVAEVKLPRK